MSHTKGPWKIVSKGATIYQIGPIYAEEYAGESWLEVSGADANLISATPDLLEALEDLVISITERYDMENPSTNPGMKCAVEAAQGAIAKARGENNEWTN